MKKENQIVYRRRRAVPTDSPCGKSHEELQSYELAMQYGHDCYIAAELSEFEVQQEVHFQVGDNRTYGGYHNAPLQKGQAYDVWFGLKVSVDGETVSSYTKANAFVVRECRSVGYGVDISIIL